MKSAVAASLADRPAARVSGERGRSAVALGREVAECGQRCQSAASRGARYCPRSGKSPDAGGSAHMIQRFLGVSVGALVTFLILWFSTVTNPVDLMPWYVAAAVIGAIASFIWPIVIGFWLGRRARARRDESIQKEVDKQLAEQNKG
jgi:hypothetical protein